MSLVIARGSALRIVYSIFLHVARKDVDGVTKDLDELKSLPRDVVIEVLSEEIDSNRAIALSGKTPKPVELWLKRQLRVLERVLRIIKGIPVEAVVPTQEKQRL